MNTKSMLSGMLLGSFVAAVSLLGGCAVDAGEGTGTSSEALTKSGNPTGPGGSGGTGGGYIVPPFCNGAEECCISGGEEMSLSTCGALLEGAGCQSITSSESTFASAVEEDGFSHWWFEVFCPNTTAAMNVVTSATCVGAGVAVNYDNNCTELAKPPPVNFVAVIYDPNCPSGCMKNLH